MDLTILKFTASPPEIRWTYISIEIKYGSGSELTYNYKYLKINGPEDKFTLHIGQLQHPSLGRDNMAYHNGRPFSTYDKDNDRWSSGNCAQSSSHAGGDHGGGWWFDNCSVSACVHQTSS